MGELRKRSESSKNSLAGSENRENDEENVLTIGRLRLRLLKRKNADSSSHGPTYLALQERSYEDVQSLSSGSISTNMMEDPINNILFFNPFRKGPPASFVVKQTRENDETGLDNYIHHETAAMTIYRGPETLSASLGDWLQASESLLRSDEMHLFLASTMHVVGSVGDLAVRTAFFPVTFPLHVFCSTTGIVIGSTMHIVGAAGSLIESKVLGTSGQATGEDEGNNLIVSLLRGAWHFPGCICHFAGHVTNGILLTAKGGATDPLEEPQLKACSSVKTTSLTSTKAMLSESTSERLHILDKLRLDYAPHDSELPAGKSFKSVPSSEYLLRVDDLGVSVKDGKDQDAKVFYMDLSSSDDSKIIQQALHKLIVSGVSLLANHPTVRLAKHYSVAPEHVINWKAEAATGKLLRVMAKMSTMERLQLLQEKVLIWSGTFQNEKNKNALPGFLARGIVQNKSPRQFMELLWDNSRTSEYNNYCVQRVDALVIEDKVLAGASEGAKVVQSETRVPFTNMTVKAKCLMHVRPLVAPDVGFVILSRSLDSGDAGMHVNSASGVERASKNEIIWGINVFRAVPNHPHLTDLTSFSQVSSSLVPTFMANRIGLMGVDDFFKNVRAKKDFHRASTA